MGCVPYLVGAWFVSIAVSIPSPLSVGDMFPGKRCIDYFIYIVFQAFEEKRSAQTLLGALSYISVETGNMSEIRSWLFSSKNCL
jgi:hypothetical protein